MNWSKMNWSKMNFLWIDCFFVLFCETMKYKITKYQKLKIDFFSQFWLTRGIVI